MPRYSEKDRKKHSDHHRKKQNESEKKIIITHEKRISSGNFTPIFTSICGSLNSPFNSNGFFMRIGNIVTVSFSVTFTALLVEDDLIGANFIVLLPLPARFNFNNINQITGTVSVLSNNPSTSSISGTFI